MPPRRSTLRQLELGVRLERAMLERKFGIAEKRAKRDLLDLSRAGLMAFIRRGRVGHYRLNASA